MRYSSIVILLLYGLAPLPSHAALISFSASGSNLFPSLGPIHAGDSFLASGSWDSTSTTNICPNNPLGIFCSPLLSYSLTMPETDGFSVTSVSNPQVVFAAASYSSQGGFFQNIRVDEISSTDNNLYVFSYSTLDGGVLTPDFRQDSSALVYRLVTSSIPEPRTAGLILAGLVCILTLAGPRPQAHPTATLTVGENRISQYIEMWGDYGSKSLGTGAEVPNACQKHRKMS